MQTSMTKETSLIQNAKNDELTTPPLDKPSEAQKNEENTIRVPFPQPPYCSRNATRRDSVTEASNDIKDYMLNAPEGEKYFWEALQKAYEEIGKKELKRSNRNSYKVPQLLYDHNQINVCTSNNIRPLPIYNIRNQLKDKFSKTTAPINSNQDHVILSGKTVNELYSIAPNGSEAYCDEMTYLLHAKLLENGIKPEQLIKIEVEYNVEGYFTHEKYDHTLLVFNHKGFDENKLNNNELIICLEPISDYVFLDPWSKEKVFIGNSRKEVESFLLSSLYEMLPTTTSNLKHKVKMEIYETP